MSLGMNGYSTPRGFVPAVVLHGMLLLVLLAVLAAVLGPMLFDGRRRAEERARLTAILLEAAERLRSWRASHGRYAGSAAALGLDEPLLRAWTADSLGWAAEAWPGHFMRPLVACGVYLGADSMAPAYVVRGPGNVGCLVLKFWVRRSEP